MNPGQGVGIPGIPTRYPSGLPFLGHLGHRFVDVQFGKNALGLPCPISNAETPSAFFPRGDILSLLDHCGDGELTPCPDQSHPCRTALPGGRALRTRQALLLAISMCDSQFCLVAEQQQSCAHPPPYSGGEAHGQGALVCSCGAGPLTCGCAAMSSG